MGHRLDSPLDPASVRSVSLVRSVAPRAEGDEGLVAGRWVGGWMVSDRIKGLTSFASVNY